MIQWNPASGESIYGSLEDLKRRFGEMVKRAPKQPKANLVKEKGEGGKLRGNEADQDGEELGWRKRKRDEGDAHSEKKKRQEKHHRGEGKLRRERKRQVGERGGCRENGAYTQPKRNDEGRAGDNFESDMRSRKTGEERRSDGKRVGNEEGDGARQLQERTERQRPLEKRKRREDITKGRKRRCGRELTRSSEGARTESTSGHTLFGVNNEDGDSLAEKEVQDAEGLNDKHGGSLLNQKGGGEEAGRFLEGDGKNQRVRDFSAIKRIRFKLAGGRGANPGKSSREGGITGASKGLSDEERSSGSERPSGSKGSSDGLADSGALREKPGNMEDLRKSSCPRDSKSSSGSQSLNDSESSNGDEQRSGGESSSKEGSSGHGNSSGRSASTSDEGAETSSPMTLERRHKRRGHRERASELKEKPSPSGVENKGKHKREQPLRTTGNHHRDPQDLLRVLLRETKRQGLRHVNLLGRYDDKVEIARIFAEVADDCSAPPELREQFQDLLRLLEEGLLEGRLGWQGSERPRGQPLPTGFAMSVTIVLG
jgi:hypothetical protein